MSASGPAAASSGSSVAGFLAAFVGLYAAMHMLYFAIPDRVLAVHVHQPAIAAPAAAIAQWLAPADAVRAEGGAVQSDRARVNIVRGCDGAGLVFLSACAVAALPGRVRPKLGGVVLAVAFAYALNIVRVTMLYFIAAYRFDWFPLAHDYLVPAACVAAVGLGFAWWAGQTAPARRIIDA